MKKYLKMLPFFFVLVITFGSFTISSSRAAEDLKFISTEDLSKGIKDKSLFVVDCNTPETYQKGHIPGATHMNSSEPDAKLLPGDKKIALVFYCKNPHCMASHEGAHFALKQGYTNVWVYPLGIDGWQQAGMQTEPGK